MRHVRMLGLCLVAVFAVAAIAATSASALPEWGKCEAKAGGKYSDANCTKKASKKSPGEFEWKKATEFTENERGFRGNEVIPHKGLLTTTFIKCSGGKQEPGSCASHGEEEVTFPIEVECQREFHTGKVKGTKEVANVLVAFASCVVFGSIPCSNTPIEGEIDTNPLKGSLGYINKPNKEVGVLLTPETKHGSFAQFSCGGIITTVVGQGSKTQGTAYKETSGEENKGGNDGIISPITPVNKMTGDFTQTYTINAEDENIPSKFEGKPRELLEDYEYPPFENANKSKWSKAGETIVSESHQQGPNGSTEESEAAIKA